MPPATSSPAPQLSLICEQVLASSQATFDTNLMVPGNIPGGYRHLEAFLYAAESGASTNDPVTMQLNGDTGANYDWVVFTATAVPTTSGSGANAATSVQVANIPGSTAPANAVGIARMWLPYYASTTLRKAWRSEIQTHRGTAAGDIFIANYGGNWRSTAAITRIVLTCGNGSFVTGSRFSLYGIT